MATVLTLNKFKLEASWDYRHTNPGLSGDTVTASTFNVGKYQLAQGVAASQANLIYDSTFTLAGAATLTLDFAGGVSDRFGNTITMARIKGLMVELTDATASSGITIGGAAAAWEGWISAAGTLTLGNGGWFALFNPTAAGYVVTATTDDDLLFTNNDATNTATVNLLVIGANA